MITIIKLRVKNLVFPPIKECVISVSYLFDDILPLVAISFGQYIHPNLLDKFDHLQFGLHLATSYHDPAYALLGRE